MNAAHPILRDSCYRLESIVRYPIQRLDEIAMASSSLFLDGVQNSRRSALSQGRVLIYSVARVIYYAFGLIVFSFTDSSRLVQPSLPYACKRCAPLELSSVLRSLGASVMSSGNFLSG